MSKLAQNVEAGVKASKKGKKAPKKFNGKSKAIVIAQAEKPLTKEFIATAKEADEEIRNDIGSIQRDLTSLGSKFNLFKERGYHRALGFKVFEAWVDDVAQERGMRHSQIRLAMRINKNLVGVGEGKLPAKEVQKMSLQNANLLAGVPPKARTAKVVEAAQSYTEKKFQTEIVLPIMKKAGKAYMVPKGKGVDPKRDVEIGKIGPYHVAKEVSDNFGYALEIAAWKVRDDELDVPMIEKQLEAIAADFIGAYSKEYEEAMSAQGKVEEAQAQPAAS